MKKLLAVLLAALMLGGMLAIGASAMSNEDFAPVFAKVLPITQALTRYLVEDADDDETKMAKLLAFSTSAGLLGDLIVLSVGRTMDETIAEFPEDAWELVGAAILAGMLAGKLDEMAEEARLAFNAVFPAYAVGPLDNTPDPDPCTVCGKEPCECTTEQPCPDCGKEPCECTPPAPGPCFFASVWNFILRWFFFGFLWMK